MFLRKGVYKMYKNYGDVNFFEYGILVDGDHSDTEIQIICCQPYPNETDLYMFGECLVDITDQWIDKQAVMAYCDMTIDTYDVIQYAIACLEYYGMENFGAESYVYNYAKMTRTEIENILKYRDIASDGLEMPWLETNKYKLITYHTVGCYRGEIKDIELFSNREKLEKRYRELYRPYYGVYNPTAHEYQPSGWTLITDIRKDNYV